MDQVQILVDKSVRSLTMGNYRLALQNLSDALEVIKIRDSDDDELRKSNYVKVWATFISVVDKTLISVGSDGSFTLRAPPEFIGRENENDGGNGTRSVASIKYPANFDEMYLIVTEGSPLQPFILTTLLDFVEKEYALATEKSKTIEKLRDELVNAREFPIPPSSDNQSANLKKSRLVSSKEFQTPNRLSRGENPVVPKQNWMLKWLNDHKFSIISVLIIARIVAYIVKKYGTKQIISLTYKNLKTVADMATKITYI
ncbi:hypothetical protein AYI68_g483 [Smittium mucronatum]|uniref:Uncharacterized protein n=1 Tax=Smittium mucronatum TaxID=133383 RepID=A0A1R0H829_9FUNG|nr:hypothetical protein AYI68_g483 [Smittium mucronatum]